jgi:hypothetical protein
MARIKFVLWERYRAWWGAHQLNDEDPLVLDRMKADKMFKKQDAIQEERSKMSKRKLKKLERKKEMQFRKRQMRRDEAKVHQMEQEMREEKEAATLEEFQRLAAGGGPEASQPAK